MADDKIAERFGRDTAQHEMTVLHDDGLYRHLRFRNHHECNDGELRPGRSAYWFDLITWPGCLTVNGDCGTFTFARLADMFEFFRGGGINPQYWAEKLRAPGPAGVMEYSQEKFRRQVMDEAAEAEKDWPGLTEALEQEIFSDGADWDTGYEAGAQEALRDFEYGRTYSVRCRACGDHDEGLLYGTAETWQRKHWGLGHGSVDLARVDGFTFGDLCDWDLRDYDWQFLWCCHAILWGIGQYERQKVPSYA